MGIAETAKLAVQLNLEGNFTSGITQAESKLTGFNAAATTKTGAVSGAFSSVGRAASSMGGALSHAGSQLKGLLLGPLGLIGATTGLLSFGGAIEKGISKAQTWGLQIEKLTGITHDSAEQLSGLLAVTEKYGLSNERLAQIAGFTEKSLGNLAANSKALDKFTTEFGFHIEDAHGKVKDFNTILLQFADYWNNKAIPASEKAAAAAKLFGRGFADLVPVLNLGSAGIKAAAAEAAALGLTLTKVNVQDLAKMRESTRQLGDAMGGLELQIGLALIPAVNEVAKALTNFVSSHRTDIVNFFKNAVTEGEHLAGMLGDFAGKVGAFWNSIPPEFRDLLVKGVVADRTIKFLFGFDPIKGIGSAITGPLGSLLSKIPGLGFLQRGSSPANPMWVQSVGGGIGGSGGGIGLLGGLATGAVVAIPPILLAQDTINKLNRANDPNLTTNQKTFNTGFLPFGLGPQFNLGDTFDAQIAANKPVVTALDTLRDGIESNRIAVQTGTTQTRNAIDTENAEVTHAIREGTAALKNLHLDKSLFAQSHAAVASIIEGIQARSAARFGGTGLGKSAVEATFGRDMERLGAKIVSSGQTQAQKLDQLRTIEADLKARGDVAAQRKIDRLISTVQHQKLHVQVNVSTRVSVTDINTAVGSLSRFSTGMKGAIIGMSG